MRGPTKVVRVARTPVAWAKLTLLAVVLVGAAVIPGRASSVRTHSCHGASCRTPGSVLWTRHLTGSWLAQPGVAGTVPARRSAYAAAGGGLAVLGSGTSVSAFQAGTGKPRWHVSIGGVPAGSQIVSVRAFSGVIAIGVQPAASQAPDRDEVIVSATTGRQLRIYPASLYGGAIAADSYRTVIVGTHDVTAYANATGRVLWRRWTASRGVASRRAVCLCHPDQRWLPWLGPGNRLAPDQPSGRNTEDLAASRAGVRRNAQRSRARRRAVRGNR